MGAGKHLELFNEQSSKVEDLEEGELQKFLKVSITDLINADKLKTVHFTALRKTLEN